MEDYKRDFFIARIRAGYVPIELDGVRIIIHHPSADVALYSQEKYIQAYERAQEEGLLTEGELVDHLILQGLWSETKEDEYQRIVPGHIEYWKIELYQSLLKSNTRAKVRKYLATAKAEYERLHEIRHHYTYVTDAGYANYIKSIYLISECSKINGQPVDWDEYNINKVMAAYGSVMLQADDIRMLARTSPWNSLWGSLKATGKIFEGELTTEQQSLISWSIMYDRIHESPDCPGDDVLDDDDMLDGWLLLQKKQREADKKKQGVEGALGKASNADEVYIPVETPEDAAKIDLLNPSQVNRIKKQRLQQVKAQGTVKQQEFKDVQLKRSMQMQQALNSKLKGG